MFVADFDHRYVYIYYTRISDFSQPQISAGYVYVWVFSGSLKGHISVSSAVLLFRKNEDHNCISEPHFIVRGTL